MKGQLIVSGIVALVAFVYVFAPLPQAVEVILSDDYDACPPLNNLLGESKSVEGVFVPEGFAHIDDEKTGVSQLFMSLMDGRVVRMPVKKNAPLSASSVELVARVGKYRGEDCNDYSYDKEPLCGRPLGLCSDEKNNSLLVCESYSGLLRVNLSPPHTVHTLVSAVDHSPLSFANSVVRHPQTGRVFFTESTRHYQRRDVMQCLWDGRQSGRLMEWMSDGSVRTLKDGIHFANGLIFHPDQRSLLVASSGMAAIYRYDLQSGAWSVFRNLPCMPDNLVHLPHRGLVTVGCAFRRNKLSDMLQAHPFLRRALLMFFDPVRLSNLLPKHGMVLLLRDATGEVVHAWHDPEAKGGVAVVSEAMELNGYVFIGSWRKGDTLRYLLSNDTRLWPEEK